MVDKIDPTNQTSVEYGQSLLGRKYKQEEQYKKDSKKDARIGYATQILSGVDNLLKQRYERNIAERNAGLDQLIIQEKAEYNSLQKEFDSQAEYREASSPMVVAREKANAELFSKYGDISNLPLDNQTRIDFNKSQKELTKFHYDRYIKNKVSMPYDTAEEYTAELEALKNKRVPSGLMDSILRTTGLRDEKAREALDTELSTQRATYKGRLADRKGVTGGIDELTDEMKAAYLGARRPKENVTTESIMKIPNGRGKDISVIGITQKDSLDNTKIIGVKTLDGMLSLKKLTGISKAEALEIHADAKTKILLMKGNEALNPYGVEQYIFDNPEKFPELRAHMSAHNLTLPRVTVFGSKDEEKLKKLTEGIISNLKTEGEYKDEIEALSESHMGAFSAGIRKSIAYYDNNGIRDENNQVVRLSDVELLDYATKEQEAGLKMVSEGGYFSDNVAIYEFVSAGNYVRTLGNNDQPEEDNNEPAENDTEDTLKVKGANVVNKLLASSLFENASLEDRKIFIDKIEKKYGIEFEASTIPYNLLNSSATPMTNEGDEGDEVDEVAEVDKVEGFNIFGPPKPTSKDYSDNLRFLNTKERTLYNFNTKTIKNLKDNLANNVISSTTSSGNKKTQEASPLDIKRMKNKIIKFEKSNENILENPDSVREMQFKIQKNKQKITSLTTRLPRMKETMAPTRYAKQLENLKSLKNKDLVLQKQYANYGKNIKSKGVKETTDKKDSLLSSSSIKTKYSPKDIRKELDDGNPVFIGDPRTGKRYEVNN